VVAVMVVVVVVVVEVVLVDTAWWFLVCFHSWFLIPDIFITPKRNSALINSYSLCSYLQPWTITNLSLSQWICWFWSNGARRF
jgi:hypothetical protein